MKSIFIKKKGKSGIISESKTTKRRLRRFCMIIAVGMQDMILSFGMIFLASMPRKTGSLGIIEQRFHHNH